MLPQQITTADYLDILFEEKNKLYGAYPLRKHYAGRLFLSMMITAAIVAGAILSYYAGKSNDAVTTVTYIIDSIFRRYYCFHIPYSVFHIFHMTDY